MHTTVKNWACYIKVSKIVTTETVTTKSFDGVSGCDIFVFLVPSHRIVTTEIVTKTKHVIIVSVMTKGNTQSLYLEEIN